VSASALLALIAGLTIPAAVGVGVWLAIRTGRAEGAVDHAEGEARDASRQVEQMQELARRDVAGSLEELGDRRADRLRRLREPETDDGSDPAA